MRKPPNPARRTRRLVVQLALMAGVVVGSTLGAGIYLIEQQRIHNAERAVARMAGTARDAMSQRKDSLTRSVEALIKRIEDDSRALRQLVRQVPFEYGLAERLALGTDFHVLELAGDDGEIIASLHWPDRVESASPYPRGDRFRLLIDTPDGTRAGWFFWRTIPIGQQRISLVAGRFLDTDWLDDAAALADAAWWVADEEMDDFETSEERIGPTSSPVGDPQVELPSTAQILEAAGGAGLHVGNWRLRSIAFGGPDATGAGKIVLGRHDRADRSTWVRLRGAWVGLTVVAALAAALVGMVLGRRAARPVDQLVRAVDAIAAGKEDYDFPGIPKDEFDELVASFSRLQRSLEQQSRRSAAAERVAAWQEVARHVAHEVKNPLAPIRLTVQNLQRAREQRSESFGELFEEGAQTILEEVDQLSRLVGEFSEFARLPVPDPTDVSLEHLLDEVVELYAADPNLRILRLRGDVPAVRVDRDQIARVFKNIIGNAVEAMATGPRRELRVETEAVNGYAEVSFSDTGPGFEGDADRRLFEPYFTTKSTGTGLGMAISYRMVAEHGGEIVAENRAGGGARVTVRLPLTTP